MPSSNAGGSKNPSLQVTEKRNCQQKSKDKRKEMLKNSIKTTYNALIPSHTDIRSSCTLGLEVSKVDGKTSVSKRPMHFLRNGCKGSNSVASLHTIRLMYKLEPGYTWP